MSGHSSTKEKAVNIEDVLSRLDRVHRTPTGFVAFCPSHDGRRPKLAIREGERGILLKCWVGCDLTSICSAMGIRVADLFPESQRRSSREVVVPPKPFRLKWRGYSHKILWFSEELFLRGERVLSTARGLSPSTLTEGELATALNAIYQAHLDLDESSRMEDLAVNLRDFGIQEEKTNHAARHSAA